VRAAAFQEARFTGVTSFLETRFAGSTSFREARVADHTSFQRAEFAGHASFVGHPVRRRRRDDVSRDLDRAGRTRRGGAVPVATPATIATASPPVVTASCSVPAAATTMSPSSRVTPCARRAG
jgi:hypothetical protein